MKEDKIIFTRKNVTIKVQIFSSYMGVCQGSNVICKKGWRFPFELEPQVEWNLLTRHWGQLQSILQWHLHLFLTFFFRLFLLLLLLLLLSVGRLWKKNISPPSSIDSTAIHNAWLCYVFSRLLISNLHPFGPFVPTHLTHLKIQPFIYLLNTFL